MHDINFVGGNFLHKELSPDNYYLHHYFTGEFNNYLINYYFMFKDFYEEEKFEVFYQNFCDHTGCTCKKRWVYLVLNKLKTIEKALKEADKNFEINRVGDIKAGKMSFR